MDTPTEQQSTWQRTVTAQDTRRDTFNTTTVPAILAALQAAQPAAGWTLTTKPDDCSRHQWHTIANAAGEAFSLTLNDWKYRISVGATYGTLPDGTNWYPSSYSGLTSPAPTMDPDKAPAKIAADILRRFLPAYRICRAEYLARVAEQTQYRADVTGGLTALVAAARGLLTVHPRHPSNERGRLPTVADFGHEREGSPVRYGSVDVSSEDAEIKIRLTHENAVALLAWLADRAEGGR